MSANRADAAIAPLGPSLASVHRRAARRAQLLEAAIGAIRTLGPTATMEQLARAGGVTKPILYRHFGDRDGLIDAIAEQFSAGLLESVEAPLRSRAQPRAMVEATIEAYVAFLEGDPDLYRFLVRHPPRGARSVVALVDVVARQVAEIFAEQLGAGGRDTEAAMSWAYGIVGLVHTATDWWLRDRSVPRDRLVGHLTELLWHGIAGPRARVPAALADS